jgi:hypothetical protein
MQVKHRLFALAVVPVLSLFTAVAIAAKPGPDPAEKYAPSDEIFAGNGEIVSGVIKKCTTGTLFKNVNPFISGGNPDDFPVVRPESFFVDGQEIELVVSWEADNSFSYGFGASKEGLMHQVGVENNSDKIIYKYDSDSPVLADGGLNVLLAGGTADKANHIDICISPVDAVDPDVSIRVVPSTDDGTTTTVAGIVSIIATIIDESRPGPTDLDITIVSADDGTDFTPVFPDPVPSECESEAADCIEYTYTWDTSLVPPGVYTITIDAADTSVLKNVGSSSKTVTVVTAAINCLENGAISGGEDGTDQGCNPSGFQWVELPDGLGEAGLLVGQTLTQAAVPALSGAQDDVCGGPAVNGERPFPFVGRDPRWGELSVGVYNPRELDLSEVFDLGAFIPAPVAGKAVMRADTRGEPCLAVIFGDASFSFEDFYDDTVSLFGANRYTYALTQLPETPELGLPIPLDVGPLGPNQIDLQKVPEATYQPTDRFIEPFIGNQLGPFTSEVFNPNRVRVPDFSYYVLGAVQICESLLASGLGPDDGRPYYDAVLQCSTDLAVEYFDDLDILLEYVGAPSLPNYPQACLVEPSAQNLRVELNKARSMIKVGDWTKADTRLDDLLLDVKQATWLVDDRNCPGHVVMRLENLLWRTAQLEEAESLLPLP